MTKIVSDVLKSICGSLPSGEYQVTVSIDAGCIRLLSMGKDHSMCPFRIAKDKKEAFLLIVWAMYMNGLFVMADSQDDDEKQVESLKTVMKWFGVPFNVTYNNPHQILADILSRECCVDVIYELLNTVSSKYVKKKNK
jgi:hypothetical protein